MTGRVTAADRNIYDSIILMEAVNQDTGAQIGDRGITLISELRLEKISGLFIINLS